MAQESGRVGCAETGSRPTGQAAARLDATRFDPARGALNEDIAALVEAARNLLARANGHYMNAEDRYCFEACLEAVEAREFVPGAYISGTLRETSPSPAKDTPQRLEFRPDYEGNFDEIVARFADGMVHVETMSSTSCYVGFYWDDGRYCQWWINGNGRLSYHHEDGQDRPPRFNAWGEEQNPPRDRDATCEDAPATEGEASQPGAQSGIAQPTDFAPKSGEK